MPAKPTELRDMIRGWTELAGDNACRPLLLLLLFASQKYNVKEWRCEAKRKHGRQISGHLVSVPFCFVLSLVFSLVGNVPSFSDGLAGGQRNWRTSAGEEMMHSHTEHDELLVSNTITTCWDGSLEGRGRLLNLVGVHSLREMRKRVSKTPDQSRVLIVPGRTATWRPRN